MLRHLLDKKDGNDVIYHKHSRLISRPSFIHRRLWSSDGAGIVGVFETRSEFKKYAEAAFFKSGFWRETVVGASEFAKATYLDFLRRITLVSATELWRLVAWELFSSKEKLFCVANESLKQESLRLQKSFNPSGLILFL